MNEDDSDSLIATVDTEMTEEGKTITTMAVGEKNNDAVNATTKASLFSALKKATTTSGEASYNNNVNSIGMYTNKKENT